jgi:hypothetical protein
MESLFNDDALRERVRRSIERHWRVLNRLDPHLGCIRCGRILYPDGRCEVCDAE